MISLPNLKSEDIVAYGEAFKIKNIDGLNVGAWADTYDAYCRGHIDSNFEERHKEWSKSVFKNFKILNSTKDEIVVEEAAKNLLCLGWNPSVPYNEHTRSMGQHVTFCNKKNIQTLNEKHEGKNPIYVVLTYTGTQLSKVIKKKTSGIYTHAGFSLDLDLDNIYTFNIQSRGFAVETAESCAVGENNKMVVYATYINDANYNNVKRMLHKYAKNVKKTDYSFINLIAIMFNKHMDLDAMNMTCSNFTNSMLMHANAANVDTKSASLVTPNDLHVSLDSSDMYKVYEGPIMEYNKTRAGRAMQSYRRTIGESTNIEFDNEGNLFIQNFKYDYEKEFNKSHTLLKSYDDSSNIEGMKFELAKLYYMNTLLEDKVFSKTISKEEKKQYVDIRARILNVFNKYIRIVQKYDKSFNFEEYYNTTTFSTTTKRISKNTLKHGTDLIARMIKVFV